MKACFAALVFSASFLGVSVGFCRQEKAVSERAQAKNASVYAELSRAPEKARAKTNPLSQDPGAIPAGRLLFERHCAECHGDNAEGKKGPNLRAEEVQSAPPGAIFWVLTNGVVRHGMPVWSRLPEPERWQLVSYLKSLGVGAPRGAPVVPLGTRDTNPSK
jgi:mono/diheme cytochrome c family protein